MLLLVDGAALHLGPLVCCLWHLIEYVLDSTELGAGQIRLLVVAEIQMSLVQVVIVD